MNSRSRQTPNFDERWQEWLRTNLKRGVPRNKLLDRLIARGFDPEFCERQLASTAHDENQSEQLVGSGRLGISFQHAPPFVEVKGFLSKGDVEAILADPQAAELRPGRIGKGIEDHSIRNNSISWVNLHTTNLKIEDRLREEIIAINRQNYMFNITEHVTTAQLSRYEVGSHYGFHQDFGRGASKMRKLTCIVLLCDDYTGGDLELFFAHTPKAMRRDVGTLIVFPSYTLHRVTPVLSGTRISLVCWSLGPPFC